MSEQNENQLQSLKKSYKKILIYKYLLFFAFIGVALTYLFNADTEARPWLVGVRDVIIFSGLISLSISVLSDIVLKKESDAIAKMERQDFAQQFATEFYSRHAIELMPATTTRGLVKAPSNRAIVVQALSELVVSDPKLQQFVSRSYFEPINAPPRHSRINIVSRLTNFNNETGDYVWNCRQQFTEIGDTLNFRLFACVDPDLSGRLESAGRVLDFILLLSNYVQSDMETWIKDDLKISGGYIDKETMNYVPIEIKKSRDMAELTKTCGIKDIDQTLGAYVRFYTSKKIPQHSQFELEFKQTLNVYQDPFFCWTFQDFAFVETLEIDYSELRKHLGRASAIPYFRSSVCQFVHSSAEGLMRITLNDMVSPGEGLVLVFRRS